MCRFVLRTSAARSSDDTPMAECPTYSVSVAWSHRTTEGTKLDVPSNLSVSGCSKCSVKTETTEFVVPRSIPMALTPRGAFGVWDCSRADRTVEGRVELDLGRNGTTVMYSSTPCCGKHRSEHSSIAAPRQEHNECKDWATVSTGQTAI